MKKLMFVAAVAAAMTGLADVEGSNIVGYQNAEVKTLSSVGIPTFVGLGGGDVALQDLKIVCDSYIPGGLVQISELNADSTTGRIYYWIPEEEAEGYGLEHAGWFDTEDSCPAEKVFDAGEGFVFSNDFEDDPVKIVYSGEVVEGAVECPVGLLNTVAGNMTPVEVGIQSIVILSETYVTGGLVQLSEMNADTTTGRIYYWIPEEEAEGYGLEHAGWFDTEDGCPAEKVFAAGEGFLFSNDFEDDAVTFKVPACL